MRTLTVLASLLVLLVPVLRAQAAPTAKSAPLRWGPAPAVFPTGAKMAVVTGDPGQAAPFAVELAMPAGYKIPPHFHPTAETVTVKKGVLLIGMGDTFEPAKMKAMEAGGTGSVPANAHHFAAAKGATVIVVSAMGPFAMTYVNPADDPQKPRTTP